MQVMADSLSTFSNSKDEDSDDEVSLKSGKKPDTSEATMSSKRQLKFMQMWGERRQLFPDRSSSAQQQQQRPAVPAEARGQTPSRTFVPSSAWRGLPDNVSAESGARPKADHTNAGIHGKPIEDLHDDKSTCSSSSEDVEEDQLTEAPSKSNEQVLSEESALSVQSLCEAAAAAAATVCDSTAGSAEPKVASTMASRDPAEVAALLQNIRLGRRHLYEDDSFAVRLERDLRVELRDELDRQQRLDARLDSLSFGAEDTVETAPAHEAAPEASKESEPIPQKPFSDNFNSAAQNSAASIVSAQSRRCVGAIGVRNSGEPDPAPKPSAKLNRIVKQPPAASLPAAASAVKKALPAPTISPTRVPAAAPARAPVLRRAQYIANSISGNSSSDSSSSDSDPQANNICRFRKTRLSSSGAKNSNCNNVNEPDCGSKLDLGNDADEDVIIHDTNNGRPMKRGVFQVQGQTSPPKQPDTRLLTGRDPKPSNSEFEANLDYPVQLHRIYQSVEKLEPSGAVRIIDPRQMIADLDGGLDTDQLESVPSNCEVTSGSVSFSPNAQCTKVTGSKPSSDIGKTEQSTEPPTATVRQSRRHSKRHHNEDKTNQAAKPANAHNVDKSGSAKQALCSSRECNDKKNKVDEQKRSKSQLFQSKQLSATRQTFGYLGTQDSPSLFDDEEVPVDHMARQIVAHRRSQSGHDRGNSDNPIDYRSGRASAGSEDISELLYSQSGGLEDEYAAAEKFITGRHGRISVTGHVALQSPMSNSTLSAGQIKAPNSRVDKKPQSRLESSNKESDIAQHPHLNAGRHNCNSSNRIGILKPRFKRTRFKPTKCKLATHCTESHLTSEGSKEALVPVRRQCRQAVSLQPQLVHTDAQLRLVKIDSRAAIQHFRAVEPVSATHIRSGDGAMDWVEDDKIRSMTTATSDRGDDLRLKTFAASRHATGLAPMMGPANQQSPEEQLQQSEDQKQPDRQRFAPHWMRLRSLPQLRKPTIARVRRVLNDSEDLKALVALRRYPNRVIRSNLLKLNVSHCTEIVENPSLITASDCDMQHSKLEGPSLDSSRLFSEFTSGTITAGTVSFNSLLTNELGKGCLSTFDAATVRSQFSDGPAQRRGFRWISSGLSLTQIPVHEPGYLPTPVYLYCTCAMVVKGSNGTHLARRHSRPKVGVSHIVYYLPNVTVFRRKDDTPRRPRRIGLVYDSAASVSAGALSVTLLISCNLSVRTF